jgi:hypothetical protein
MRHFLHRPTILLAVLLFLGGASAEPWELHGCVHHGSPPGAVAEAAHAGHGVAQDSGTTEEGAGHEFASGLGHAPRHGPDHESGDHGPCTCVGTCGATGGASFGVPAASIAFGVSVGVAEVPGRIRDEGRRDELLDLLPWPNAPPA